MRESMKEPMEEQKNEQTMSQDNEVVDSSDAVELPQENKDQNNNQNTILAIGIAIVLVLIIVVGGYLYIRNGSLFTTTDKGFSNDLTGTLYLTLRRNVPEQRGQGIYSYNIGEKKLRAMRNDGYLNLTQHLSNNGQSLVYAAVSPNNDGIQLYQVDTNTDVRTQITNSDTILKRNPEWSPQGDVVAFIAKEAEKDTSVSTKSSTWNVYVTNLTGNEERISDGIYPQWIDDGKGLAFLRDDGIYTYFFDTKEVKRVWSFLGSSVFSNMKFDVSQDGTKIAWSNPQKGEVVVIDVRGWQPFEGAIRNRIKTHAFWTVFSPDSQYLAVQTVNWETLTSDPKPRIEVYDMENYESVNILDLNAYEQTRMFLTDWK